MICSFHISTVVTSINAARVRERELTPIWPLINIQQPFTKHPHAIYTIFRVYIFTVISIEASLLLL